MVTTKFIGSGIIFPITLNSYGRPDYVNDSRLIFSSILTILSWPKHTRFFNELFGSRIHELIEEPNDNIAKSLLRTFVVEAISNHEKRVDVKTIELESYDLQKVNISITFVIKNTKIEETYIFPYYKSVA